MFDLRRNERDDVAAGYPEVLRRLDPDVARYVPYGPEQIKSLIQLDIAAMNEHVAQWVERCNKEVERK